MSERQRLLIVDDDNALRSMLDRDVREWGWDIATAAGGEEALAMLAQHRPDVVLTDVRMPGINGRDLLSEIRAREPGVPVILMTAFASIDAAVEAVRAGAHGYLSKPFPLQQLRAALEEARQLRALTLSLSAHGTSAATSSVPVAASQAMKPVLEMVRRAASSSTPVLFVGESGTGKELLARTLHENGPRKERNFLGINCSALPETLLDSQLFGHRKGSFTDAREDRRGLVQEADGGTLFLDEVGDMSSALQAKLLRVIQEREVHPVGAPAPVSVDVRIVAATHRDLETLVAGGRFRQDLYYRLNVITVRVPPLRERPEDIVPLLSFLLDKHARKLGRPVPAVSAEALHRFQVAQWPGNVREMENAIERALVLGVDEVLDVDDLPPTMRRSMSAAATAAGRRLDEIEREHIERTLRAVKGNKAEAARLLGVDRKTLYRKIAQYNQETAAEEEEEQ